MRHSASIGALFTLCSLYTGGCGDNPPLTIQSATVVVAPKQPLPLSAAGGADGGYAWSFMTNESGGTLTPDGMYSAGPIGNVTDVLAVTDSDGNQATLSMSVGPILVIADPGPAMPPLMSLTLSASGGSGKGFVWSIATNNSGGAIDPATGEYVAGSVGGVSDLIVVTDDLGNTGTTSISVLAP